MVLTFNLTKIEAVVLVIAPVKWYHLPFCPLFLPPPPHPPRLSPPLLSMYTLYSWAPALCVTPAVQLVDKRKSKDTEKRSRLDKEKVMDMLFAAFEKHQYYNVKDLVGITKQPIVSVWCSWLVY